MMLLFAALVFAAPPPGGSAGGDVQYDKKGIDDDSGDKLEDPTGVPSPELKPDPYDDRIDEDEGEPPPPLELPPDGLALRPGLPYLDRDIIAPRSYPAGRGSATVSLQSIGEDDYLSLNIGYVFQKDKWRVAPRLPLRFRINDEPPETDDVIRVEDYDEVSDFARILAFVQYGHVGDPLVVRYGEMNGITIGHGSIVNRYFNTIDIDHYQGGVYAFGDADLIGAEGVLNDVFDPNVLVGRVFTRPLWFIKDLPLPLHGLKIGVTAGADFAAPLAIKQQGEKLFTTPEWEPEVLVKRATGMYALDLEVPCVSTPHLDVVPYVDLATRDFETLGVHVGSFVNVRVTRKTTLRARIEYRHIGAGHDPGYISPFYEIERFAYPAPLLGSEVDGELGGLPKLRLAQAQLPPFARSYDGAHLELDLRIERALALSVLFTSSGRTPRYDLLTRLKLPNLGPLRLTLFLARLGFDDFDFSEIFGNERTVMGISMRLMVVGPFFMRAKIVKEWWLARDGSGASGYRTVTDWDLGAGVILDF